mgnify:FL=1
MHAVNLYDAIPIKRVRTIVSGKVLDFSPQQMDVEYGENSYLFVFRFGCVVFFNMSPELVQSETAKIKTELGAGFPHPTSETYQVTTGAIADKVEFEYVEIKKYSIDHLRLIALTLGQSTGLEYFEILSDKLLQDTASFMKKLETSGSFPTNSKRLLQFIGSTAGSRQQIVSNLSILDPPEETWKSKELEKFFKELQLNFDIDLRFRALDRKLNLVQDNIEILSDLATARRTTILELLIVILIVLELIMAAFQRFG